MQITTININLAPATLEALSSMGYALYVMRSFDTTNAAGKPLVWFASTQFLESNSIAFEAQYQAYVPTSQVIPNGVVIASDTVPVELGQTVTIDVNGVLTVTQGGNPAGVTLVNSTTRPFTTGLMATANSAGFGPIFAEPLYGLAEDIAAPADQFLLTFSTDGVPPGSVIQHAMAQSLLVDLTGATERTVAFDINTGWSAGGATWATTVPAGADLTPVLVHEKPLVRR